MGERQLLVSGEVKIGENHLAFLHSGPLGLDWLLDLHDHVGFAPNCVGVGTDLRANGRIGRVRKTASFAGSLLHHDVVPRSNQRFRTGRNERDTILVGLYLFRYADLHLEIRS